MATPSDKVRSIHPPQMVKDAVAQAETTLQAAELLKQWARKTPSLKAYLLEPWLERACYVAVSTVHRANRRAVWTAPNYDKGGKGERVLLHGRLLLDFPLPGGVLLRYAKQKDLEIAAHIYRQRAEDEMSKAVWLERIAAKVGTRKVESVFTEEQLQRLKGE